MNAKPYKATPKRRAAVMLHVACGMSEREIAAVMKVSRETLRKHYLDELLEGRARIAAEINAKLKALVDKGNVSAMKALDAKISGHPTTNANYVSKKSVQEKAAKEAGGEHSEWGDDLRSAPTVPAS